VNAVEVGIIATSLKISLKTSYTSYMRVWIDGVEQDDWILIDSKTTADYVVAEGLEFGYHSIKIVKATEMQLATWAIASFDAETFATPVEKPELKIEFIGDSITAGYGVLGVQGEGRTVHNSDSTKSYAYQTAMLLNADCSVVAWSGICAKAFHWAKDINMDYLYELQSYANRNEYAFKFKPNIVVLNLGTNDADYINSVNPSYKASFATDYLDFLKFVRAKNPNAYIICLYGMMGASQTVDSGILSAVESLADSKIVYNPIQITANFEGAGGHPNLAAQTSWAELLAAYINTLNL
jgi:lysophospholipase L1-like esterase